MTMAFETIAILKSNISYLGFPNSYAFPSKRLINNLIEEKFVRKLEDNDVTAFCYGASDAPNFTSNPRCHVGLRQVAASDLVTARYAVHGADLRNNFNRFHIFF